MTDELAWHDQALDMLDRLVGNVTTGHLARPTPCTEWDVGGLLTHLAAGNRMFTVAAGGQPPLVQPGDPVADYAATAAALRVAWDQPGVLDRPATLPWGEAPGFVALRMHFVDLTVHGWDLAVATGQHAGLDTTVAEIVYQEMSAHLDDESRGEGEAFAAQVPWPSNAPIRERLLAFLGRDPHWRRTT